MMFHVIFPVITSFRCYVNQNGGHSNTQVFAQYDGYSQQFHRLPTRSDQGRKLRRKRPSVMNSASFKV